MPIARVAVSILIALPLLGLVAAGPRIQDATTAPPPAVELNEQEQAVVDWLKEAATPLETAEAGNGLEDMQPIRELVGEARLVSLGESTHGTREIFQMKHRMLEFLVTEMGFTLFGIEASMPDCIAINEYVLTGQGNVRSAVAGQGFWTWNTDEVVEMVEWMRAYNADPANAGKPKLKFYGYDMQNPGSAVATTLKFLEKVDLEAAKAFAPRIQSEAMNLQQFDRTDKAIIESTGKALEEAGAYLDERAEAFTEQTSRDEYTMARRCVVVAQQGLEMMEQMRGQASSPERQQLFMRLPGQLRELNKFLEVYPDIGSAEARTLVADLTNLEQFASRYMAADTADEQRQEWATLAAELEEAVKAGTADDPAGTAARAQAADVVAVFEALESIPRQGGGTQNIRDRSMAQNIRWILEHEGPDAKIVLWAHNGHTNITPGDPEKTFAAMGSYLEKWFGDDHIPVGFAFGKGSFQAVAARPEAVPPNTVGLPEWTVDWAKPGSVDRVMASAGIPLFIVDLRRAEGAARQWLTTPHPWRMAGAVFDPVAAEDYYRPQAPGFAFEALIYIAETTRARPSMGFGPQAMGQQRPRLGIQFGPAEEGLPGAMINQVVEGTPAEAAGLRVGDRVIRVGEDEIADIMAFQQALGPQLLKESVRLTVVRDGKEIEVEVKLKPAE